MADDVLFVFCWDHECVSAYGMCPLVVVVVVVVVGGGGKGLKVNLLPWQSPMNKYMDCAEYILLIYCLICLFESLCLLAAFDTSDFFVVPVEWKTDKQNTVMPQKCTTRNAEKKKNKTTTIIKQLQDRPLSWHKNKSNIVHTLVMKKKVHKFLSCDLNGPMCNFVRKSYEKKSSAYDTARKAYWLMWVHSVTKIQTQWSCDKILIDWVRSSPMWK